MAWIDEQVGDFLAFIIAELITKRSFLFFLEETRSLFLAFSPMAQEDSPKVSGAKNPMLSNISFWEAGGDMTDIKKEKVKILWHQHSLKISDQKISPTPTHLAEGKFLQNILYLLFWARSVSPG